MRRRVLYVMSGLVLVSCILLDRPAEAQVNAGNDAATAQMSVSDVFPFGDTTTTIPAASSRLVRTSHSVSVTVSTRGLIPGNVYTIWWIIFAKPVFCAAATCGLADLGNPNVQASVVWATGRVADAQGQAIFTAHLVPGNPEGPVLVGNAAFNPLVADLHQVVRDHNEIGANGATLLQQLTTLNAGCVGACVDVQAAIHER